MTMLFDSLTSKSLLQQMCPRDRICSIIFFGQQHWITLTLPLFWCTQQQQSGTFLNCMAPSLFFRVALKMPPPQQSKKIHQFDRISFQRRHRQGHRRNSIFAQSTVFLSFSFFRLSPQGYSSGREVKINGETRAAWAECLV